jgi:hypothetical protein
VTIPLALVSDVEVTPSEMIKVGMARAELVMATAPKATISVLSFFISFSFLLCCVVILV